MRITTNIRTILIFTLLFIFIVSIYFFKQSQWKSKNTISKAMDSINFAVYKHLLEDIGKHKRWSLSSFLKNSGFNNNSSSIMSKRRICIVSVDTRPLERFSAVNNIDKMNFYSVSAYYHLFYGKEKSLSHLISY